LSSFNIGTQINESEETTQLSPSITHKTTTYESRRIVGSGQPAFGITSTGIRTYSPSISLRSNREMTNDLSNEQEVEEKYEVTVSSVYDESGLKILSSNPLTISSDINQGFDIFDKKTISLFYKIDLNLMKKCI
jgi:hypothetical protein